MKFSLVLLVVLLSLLFVFDLVNGKKYGKVKSKGPIKKAIDIVKHNPKTAIGVVVGGYVAHKAIKKIKKPFKIGGDGLMRNMMMMNMMVGGGGWGYRSPYGHNYYYQSPISRIIVHHTETADCYEMAACAEILQQMQNQRLGVEGRPDIGYNFMIGGDGRIYEGLGWQSYGHYRPIMGEESISVAFIGDFSVYRPTDAQIAAFNRLIKFGDDKDLLKSYRIHAHRDLACTACPGDALYNLIRTMARYRSLPEMHCPTLTGQIVPVMEHL